MDMISERKRLELLIRANWERLCILEQQEARFGFSTPPETVVEIKHLREKIEELQNDLRKITPTAIDLTNKLTEFEEIEVVIKGHLETLTDYQRQATILAIAAITGISPNNIHISRVFAGSVVFRLSMPIPAISRLVKLDQCNHPVLKELGIQDIRTPDQALQIQEEIAMKSEIYKKELAAKAVVIHADIQRVGPIIQAKIAERAQRIPEQISRLVSRINTDINTMATIIKAEINRRDRRIRAKATGDLSFLLANMQE